MKNKVFSKIALAFTILTVIAFSVAIAPGVLSALLAMLAIVISFFAIVVYIFGGFIGLLAWAGDGGSILHGVNSLGLSSFHAAGKLFSILPPMAEFCFSDFSPICTYVGIGCGVVALIFSIIALTTAESKVSKVLKPGQPPAAPTTVPPAVPPTVPPAAYGGQGAPQAPQYYYDVYTGQWKENTQWQPVYAPANYQKGKKSKKQKPKKPKKQRTDRGIAILCIVLSSVFTVLNVLAVLLIKFLAAAFFVS